MRKRRTAKTREQRNQDAKERMRRVALERSMKLDDYIDDESVIAKAISAFDKKREGGVQCPIPQSGYPCVTGLSNSTFQKR